MGALKTTWSAPTPNFVWGETSNIPLGFAGGGCGREMCIPRETTKMFANGAQRPVKKPISIFHGVGISKY